MFECKYENAVLNIKFEKSNVCSYKDIAAKRGLQEYNKEMFHLQIPQNLMNVAVNYYILFLMFFIKMLLYKLAQKSNQIHDF